MHSSRMRTARSSSHRGGGSPSVHAGIDPPGVGLKIPVPDPPQLSPWVWAWRPPSQIPLNFPLGCGPGDPLSQIPLNFPLGCGPGDPPGQIPLNFPLGCGPGNLQGMLGYHRPGELLQDMLGYHLQCMLGYHFPCEQNDRQVQKYNLASNFVCRQ